MIHLVVELVETPFFFLFFLPQEAETQNKFGGDNHFLDGAILPSSQIWVNAAPKLWCQPKT